MECILSEINSPADVHRLSPEKKAALAEELRVEIVDRVSKNGGHLASNLGVVELTIALLSVFDPPNDQIVFDVGHQCYPYKLLTGRTNRFSCLRQKEGLSGFPNINESCYDCFGTGHSSTSVSAAVGLLRAKKIRNENDHVIAVIGDGALSGGMVYEALNDAGHLGDNLIVIINDNQMSIDENVGALSRHLDRLRFTSGYLKMKSKTEKMLNAIPFFGKLLSRIIIFFKDSLRLIIHRKRPVFFEGLGFRYYGPIDGHNIPLLVKKLEAIKQINEPVIFHVCTQKGKGYRHAEDLPAQYHGVAPFDLENGCDFSDSESFTKAFSQSLVRLGEERSDFVAVCAGMMSSTGLDAFSKTFPNRFVDVGIAEEHAVTMAAGLSANGIIPVVALYSTFLQRSYDQILHDVCLQNLHVVFAVDRAGIVGPDGPTHQGLYDIAMLSAMPNMEVLAPRDYNELDTMLRYAVIQAKGPVAVRYPRAKECKIYADHYLDEIKIQELKKGTDIAIISAGAMIGEAALASEMLERQGVSCALYDVRRIVPLDEDEIIQICKDKKMIVSCEDGVITGGLSSKIAQILSEHCPGVPVVPIGVKGSIAPMGTRSELFRMEKMDAKSIVDKVKSKGYGCA